MARFGGMHEEGWRACRGQGRGDLAADMAALADTRDDDAAAGRPDDGHGLSEGLGKAVVERLMEGG
jgi:hypothetical protein